MNEQGMLIVRLGARPNAWVLGFSYAEELVEDDEEVDMSFLPPFAKGTENEVLYVENAVSVSPSKPWMAVLLHHTQTIHAVSAENGAEAGADGTCLGDEHGPAAHYGRTPKECAAGAEVHANSGEGRAGACPCGYLGRGWGGGWRGSSVIRRGQACVCVRLDVAPRYPGQGNAGLPP